MRFQGQPVYNQLVSLPVSGGHIHLKRLDALHPHINGNKWFKLKYNVEAAVAEGHRTLLTMGGAYSNHVYATAAAGRELGLRTVGIIRGEEPLEYSSTLQFARECGMQLHFVSRSQYRERDHTSFIEGMVRLWGPCYVIPEGGSNAQGVKGAAEILTVEDESWNFICCPMGTGATAAGLLLGSNTAQKVLGFSALQSEDFHLRQLKKFLGYETSQTVVEELLNRFVSVNEFHFGGFAKWNKALIDYIRLFESLNEVRLEQVYTAKMIFGIDQMLVDGRLPVDGAVLAIHTGGLQGRLHELQ